MARLLRIGSSLGGGKDIGVARAASVAQRSQALDYSGVLIDLIGGWEREELTCYHLVE